MANEVFQLIAVTRLLEEEMRLVEVIGMPEVSVLAPNERKSHAGIQAKAKEILEDLDLSPLLSLHRRRIGGKVEVDEFEVTIDPPRHRPEWEEAATLRLQYVRWTEGTHHLAWVPPVGVLVFATRADLLPARLAQHVKLVLAGRRTHVTLGELSRLNRIEALSVEPLSVTADLKTPVAIASAAGSDEEKPPSTLAKVAEELPPLVIGKVEGHPPKLVPAAYELESELKQLVEALSGPARRAVLLVGPAGSGKTALVHELALRRWELGLEAMPFWTTTGARLMGGQIGFGMWQERCQQVVQEVVKTNAIVHLGNLAELLEVGRANRNEASVGGFLRPAIARGELLAIAECTPEQVGAIEREEPHLLGAFRQLTITERTPAQTRRILDRVLEHLPGTLALEPATTTGLDQLHQLHQRYATYSANPGRPVRFLKNFLADRFPDKTVQEPEVIEAFSRETGLPLVLLDDRVALNLAETERWFAQRVIGQGDAVQHVLDVLALIKARLARPKKPLASLLFIGPTGVGKTEMAKALAAFLYGDASRMVRFDLNEFSDPMTVQRLIGGPGGRGAEGLLTACVREQPFSVVLLDEFEKADASFYDLLLQILGEGRLTDAAGRVADFCNSVIVMTSNLGARGFQQGPAGFRADGATTPDATEHFTDAVRKFLRPEIFNRLDAVVPFHPLTGEIVLAVTRRQLDLVCRRDGLSLRPVDLHLAPAVAEHLAATGYDVRYGARPLKRTIERDLLVPLAEALNEYATELPVRAEIGVEQGKLKFSVRARAGVSVESVKAAGEQRGGLVTEVMEQRRHVARLLRGAAFNRVEDRVELLAALERRLEKTGKKWTTVRPELAELPKLRDCVTKGRALYAKAELLEDLTLGAVYRREEIDSQRVKADVDGIGAELRVLRRQVYRHSQPDTNDVILAFYCENRFTLFQFVRAYRTVAEEGGSVEAVGYFHPPEKGRTAEVKLVFKEVEKPVDFFNEPPELVVGVVLHLRGDLYRPRFAGEHGLHQVREAGVTHVCAVEVAETAWPDYRAPAGVERKGGIKELGFEVCRTYNRGTAEVEDAKLGNRPWANEGVTQCVRVLTEERLETAINEATR
jgi:ATP-dependent Clp protease ATP-binding subunit ClpC